MHPFFEQKKDTAFDRRQMNTLCGGGATNGDSGGPLCPPPDEGDGGD